VLIADKLATFVTRLSSNLEPQFPEALRTVQVRYCDRFTFLSTSVVDCGLSVAVRIRDYHCDCDTSNDRIDNVFIFDEDDDLSGTRKGPVVSCVRHYYVQTRIRDNQTGISAGYTWTSVHCNLFNVKPVHTHTKIETSV